MTKPTKQKPKPPERPKDDHAELIRMGLVAQYARRVKEGKPLKQEEWRLLIEDRDREHTWPDRKTCAKELCEDLGRHISINQIYEWKRDGAPIPNRGPIYRDAFWKWLALEKRDKGGTVLNNKNTSTIRERLLEKQLEMLETKLAALSGTMLDAEDTIAAIDRAGEDIRNALLRDIPVKAVEIAQTKGTEDATEEIRLIITNTLNAISHLSQQCAPKVQTDANPQ